MLSEFHYVLYLYDINNSRPGRNIEQYHKECQSWINNIINSVNKMFELYQHEQRVGISSIKTHYLGMDTDRWDPSMIKMFSDDNFFYQQELSISYELSRLSFQIVMILFPTILIVIVQCILRKISNISLKITDCAILVVLKDVHFTTGRPGSSFQYQYHIKPKKFRVWDPQNIYFHKRAISVALNILWKKYAKYLLI